MKVSIMQPYIFPWIGYFQLIFQSDTFVLYDDAYYIKQGYINRNTLLCNGQAQRFTLQVPGASSFKRISELAFSGETSKITKTITQNYCKAPFFSSVMPIVEKVLSHPNRDITFCCQLAIESIFDYLELNINVLRSSSLFYDHNQSAENKVIGMCHDVGASVYVNSIGGQHLYNAKNFAQSGIKLLFLQGKNTPYYQAVDTFVPNLSIIDVLMQCAPEQVRLALANYSYSTRFLE
ncbi:hypothetical protein A6J71_09375 [Enterobacter cancerogenus]|uniref:WbqC family protein n=1 Tax=Enterobacter cancerogenus TaxID=69218 RepID=UPI000C9BB738|nr:WbqC family protein [Enterobacter cancerogenus]PNF10348.1 hypothetical protein A6J71_09375 [Enterobacter cancerogenus]